MTGTGSLFRVHLKAIAPRNYREAHLSADESAVLSKLIDYLYDDGIMMIHTATAALSTAMSESEVDQLCEALERGFNRIKHLLT